ncbi:transcriptional regulator [Symbiobacterium terraclitae]|uniref:Transcriptional regulator n=1 Tax=Symbiobacterium terraclitae TaxID=557451 RepID=A0ABS4JS90_9FIRM|nr:transcriptional regulator [Symbiobacterium terraclitae]
MQLVRIGDKVINPERIYRMVDRMLELRAQGHSQQEVAEILDVDRTLISRLESVGEMRKGKKIALVGFPVKNGPELTQMAQAEGVDFILLMSDQERLDFARSQNGIEVLNQVMRLIARARECDAVIFIGSDQRLKMVEALVGPHVIGIEIGRSPMSEDVYVDPDRVRSLIRSLQG